MRQTEIDQVVQFMISKLADTQIEVREAAALTFAGVVRSTLQSRIGSLTEQFKKDLSTPLPSKKRKAEQGPSPSPIPPQEAEAIIKRHAAVLGLASLIYANPFDVPSWMPNILELMAVHIHDPVPIQSTVKKVMADFRRTHQDTWHLDKASFTPEQLDVLSDLLVAPSYYA